MRARARSVDPAALPIVGLDEAGRVVDANSAARAWLGAGWRAKSLIRWLPSSQGEAILKRLARDPVETWMRAGRRRAVLIHPGAAYLPTGAARGVRQWLALIDVTPLARREARLRREAAADQLRLLRDATALQVANEQLQAEIFQRRQTEPVLSGLAAIVESSDDAIVSTTLDGTIVSWNGGAERLYGYAAREIEGCWVGLLVPADRQEKVGALLDRIARGERINHYETVRLRKDGSPVDVSLSVSPLRSGDGTVIGASMIARDISERKRLEAQLAQAQKFELIGQLSAGIAHEINTPIQYIGTNATFLHRGLATLERVLDAYQRLADAARCGGASEAALAPLDAAIGHTDLEFLRREMRAAIAQTTDGVRQVAKIVRSVKELAHSGSGEREPQRTPSDLATILERAITVTRNEWKYVAEVEHRFDPSLPPVPCVADELGRVLVNILVNAAQAIGETGARDAKGRIEVATRRDGEWAEIRIHDTGPGIPPEAQPRIFEPFFTTKEVGKGTGQGLAIARSIVGKHGGTIAFSTEAGRGTTFVIRLPLQPAADSDAPGTSHRAAG